MSLPLEGLRVLDITAYWAGPFCSKFLADFGAEVIKIESPVHPDLIRISLTSPATDGATYYNKSSYFNNYNRNKLSLGLDISKPAGRDIVLRLAAKSDVVVENMRADVMDNLGFGYETLRSARGDLIMVSLSGFGKTGPESRLAGIGTTMEQMSGLCSLNTYGDDVPFNTGIAYGDPNAGIMGVAAVIMALMKREETGEGSFIDLSQRENLICMIGEQLAEWFWNGRNPEPTGNGSPVMVPHGCYPCAGEDRWLTVAVTNDEEWRQLAEAIGQPSLADQYPGVLDRIANREEIDAQISMWSAVLKDEQAAAILQAAGIAASPVLDAVDHAEDEHLRARGFFAVIDDPDMGPWPHDGIAWRLSDTPGSIQRAAPRFGEHNDYVLRDILRLNESEMNELRELGVVADSF